MPGTPRRLLPTVLPPEPQTVTVIDYDLTLSCGKEIQFSLRPDLGDTEQEGTDGTFLTFARTGHKVVIKHAHLAIGSRRERQMKLPPDVEL